MVLEKVWKEKKAKWEANEEVAPLLRNLRIHCPGPEPSWIDGGGQNSSPNLMWKGHRSTLRRIGKLSGCERVPTDQIAGWMELVCQATHKVDFRGKTKN